MPLAALPDRMSMLSAPFVKRRSAYASALALACLLTLAACSGGPTGHNGTVASRSGEGERGYRTKLDGWGPKAPPSGFPKFIDHSVGQEEVSMQAMGLVGVPYQWGGNTPTTGFDCSGLVRYVVARAADVILPRTTGQMSKMGESVSPSEIAPGDLIFFNTDGGRPYSHVGIYVGDYRFVNAPSTGGTVRIDYVTNPYWAKHFDGIRRVAGLNTTPVLKTAPLLDMPDSPQPAPSSIMPPRAFASTGETQSNAPDTAPVNTSTEASRYAPTDRFVPPSVATPPTTQRLAALAPVQAGGNGPPITDPIALEIARADREADMRGESSAVSAYPNRAESSPSAAHPSAAYRAPTGDMQRYATTGRIVTPPIAASGHDDDPIARLARGY